MSGQKQHPLFFYHASIFLVPGIFENVHFLAASPSDDIHRLQFFQKLLLDK